MWRDGLISKQTPEQTSGGHVDNGQSDGQKEAESDGQGSHTDRQTVIHMERQAVDEQGGGKLNTRREVTLDTQTHATPQSRSTQPPATRRVDRASRGDERIPAPTGSPCTHPQIPLGPLLVLPAHGRGLSRTPSPQPPG